jgi:hypothetical protein
MDLETLEREAAAIVEPSAWSCIERGSGGADTRAANLAAWRRLRLRPHVLRDVTNVTTQTTVLGSLSRRPCSSRRRRCSNSRIPTASARRPAAPRRARSRRHLRR